MRSFLLINDHQIRAVIFNKWKPTEKRALRTNVAYFPLAKNISAS